MMDVKLRVRTSQLVVLQPKVRELSQSAYFGWDGS